MALNNRQNITLSVLSWRCTSDPALGSIWGEDANSFALNLEICA